jgi:hypothetical protein
MRIMFAVLQKCLSVKGFCRHTKFGNTDMESVLYVNILSLLHEDCRFAFVFGAIFTESCMK